MAPTEQVEQPSKARKLLTKTKPGTASRTLRSASKPVVKQVEKLPDVALSCEPGKPKQKTVRKKSTKTAKKSSKIKAAKPAEPPAKEATQEASNVKKAKQPSLCHHRSVDCSPCHGAVSTLFIVSQVP